MTNPRRLTVTEQIGADERRDQANGIRGHAAPVLPTRPGHCPRCRSRMLTYADSPVAPGGRRMEATCHCCGHRVDYWRVAG